MIGRRITVAWLLLAPLVVAPIHLGAASDGTARTNEDTVVVDEPTAAVIRGALEYLAAKQSPNGSWKEGRDEYTAAMTGYALIAFMATGNLPGEGEHGKAVAAGMQYLLDAMQPDGTFTPRSGQYMYGHGIATIALAELFGQTKSAAIRPKLEKAVKIILGSQNAAGGWRYSPRIGDADISVTVLQVVALRAAKNAGLDVPQGSIEKAIGYVHSCYEEKTGGFCYQPHTGAGFARTAAAIYSLQVCGQYDDPTVKSGSQYLLRQPKDIRGGGWFTYGHFYAAPALYMIGGDTWRTWYGRIKPLLLQHAKRSGELAYWGTELDGQSIGPIYSTSVYTTILAMPYHYMPLYQR